MRSKALSLFVLLLISAILAACGGGGASQNPTTAPAGEATEPAAAATEPAAQATEPAASGGGEGDLSGTVSILGAFTGAEAEAFEATLAVFEQMYPGVDVVYSGVNDFDTQVVVRVQAGDPPDIAAFPQPGGAARQAADGQLVPLWPEAQAVLDENFAPFWKELGTFDGTPYGMFHRVNAKGFIWYNKPAFEAAGYSVPTTWEELQALEEQIIADGGVPWCEGIESGAATGWKGTDWIENIMLRTQSTDVYDQWIAGDVTFTSPEVRNAFDILGEIWLDPTMVYGGQQTIVLTSVPDAATFLFTDPPNCWLHMQGSFATNFFPEEVQADLDNQVGVFVMPAIDPAVTPALEVGGDVFVVFQGKDRPEVKAFIEFLGTVESTTDWAALGGALFPHKGQDLSVYPTEIERTIAETIINAEAARFDASDAMSAEANAAFWKGITDWVSGNRDLDGALQDIDAARPQ